MSRRAATGEPLALAERAHSLVQARPRAARVAAESALRLARERCDGEAEVAALHALGFAQYALGDPNALTTIRAAVRTGSRNGNPRRAAIARRNLALYLTYAGRSGSALREIEAACASLDGIERARSEVFRIAVYGATGRAPDGLADSTRALRVLQRHGDRIWEARLRYNRGLLLMEVGDLRAAARDLEAARGLYAHAGADAAVADAEIKLAELRLLEGDPLDSLAHLDAIGTESLSEWAVCWLYLTRAKVYLALRLLKEARADLARFVDVSTRAGAADSVRKARLDAARLALLAGDASSAAALAAGARRSFAGGRQPAHWARAASLSLAAAIASGSVRPRALRTGLDAAAVFAELGHATEELRARQLVAHAAAELGALRLARREARLAEPLRRRGMVSDRVGSWHVEALLRRAEGDVAGAERALRRGLQLLDEYRSVFGAFELRAAASAHGVELAAMGLRIALESGDMDRCLVWGERLRANALRQPLVRAPSDRWLVARQTDLRRVAARIRDAEEHGRPVRALAAQQAELEAAIRARTRRVRGEPGFTPEAFRLRDATRALGERALITFLELDRELHAVTLVGGRLAMHHLGSAASAAAELEWLRVALARLARRSGSQNARAASRASASAAAAALDRQLLQPLLHELGAASLVVVPTGVLHALPWGALPSLRGRPLVVAPSLGQWLDVDGAGGAPRRKTALVAGPRLSHARREVRELAGIYPGATVLDGTAATASAVLGALDGAALAHVACHGRFRADSPLFSSLELADGPVTALDLQRLRHPPDVLVLSACDLALSDHQPGDELLGLSAALQAMGTRTLIASVVPVPDAAARRMMVVFHRELACGASPASALAHAQAGAGRSAALAGFVCLGTG